jgi:capsular polysaccharide export protein
MSPPFLRIPPFPGHRARPLSKPAERHRPQPDAPAIARALRAARVGGRFWGAQTPLPPGRDILLAPDSEAQVASMVAAMLPAEAARAMAIAPPHWRVPGTLARIGSDLDPWWLADQVAECRAGAGQDIALVCALAGKRVQVSGAGPYEQAGTSLDGTLKHAVCSDVVWTNPFFATEWTLPEAIAQLAEWRQLIDSNRSLAAIYGVARWKRVTLDPLLWDGSGRVRHAGNARRRDWRGLSVAAWKSRTAPRTLARLEAAGARIAELEDGFIRSPGLGANCVPPLSVIVDRTGVYFDPSAPSDLEGLLQDAQIGSALRSRASALRRYLLEAAISKYGVGGSRDFSRPGDGRRRVLVAGQVEDDRSVLSGGAGCTNLDLVMRTRAMEPDAWIIYKPHPDVEAGHRKGVVPQSQALQFADEIQRDAPIIPLIESVDAVHVITSLAGFEALLRGKQVTTHGLPFYAGWGLTRDLAAVPPRRSRTRTLDELVAATLLLYARYIDPVTRLPCPAEVVVQRMAAGQAGVSSPLIRLREWQGRLRLRWQRLIGRA